MLAGRKFLDQLADYLVYQQHVEIKHTFAKGRILTPAVSYTHLRVTIHEMFSFFGMF
jgi:hypothetical protein